MLLLNYIKSLMRIYQIVDKTMDKHEIISKGVKKVTYSDGSVIYFNYTDETVEVDGITLDSLSYIVKGGAN